MLSKKWKRPMTRSKQRFSLEEKVKDLITTTNKISEEANNRTALKDRLNKVTEGNHP
jgi:hypothetical protein